MEVSQCRLESEKRWTDVKLEIQKIKDEQKALVSKLSEQAQMISDIQQLSVSVSVLANNMDAMLKEQQKQNGRLENLETKPTKRWDSIVEKILTTIVVGLVTYVMVKLGIS